MSDITTLKKTYQTRFETSFQNKNTSNESWLISQEDYLPIVA